MSLDPNAARLQGSHLVRLWGSAEDWVVGTAIPGRGAWLVPAFTVPGTSGLPPGGCKSIPYKSYRLSVCPCLGGGQSPAPSPPSECLVALPGEGPWRPDSTDPRILQRLPSGSRRACSVSGWSAVDWPRRPPLGSDGRLQDSRIGSASGPNLVMFCHPTVDPQSLTWGHSGALPGGSS